MNAQACPDCGGTGQIELMEPGCKSPCHEHGAAWCLCPTLACQHSGVDCTFCDGTGLVWEPDEAMA